MSGSAGGKPKGTGTSDGLLCAGRPKGTGARDGYSVGHSGGALVPVGHSGGRPEATCASEGYSLCYTGEHWG